MPNWRDGRVVLLGDSTWCASPLSGLGTALALRGAAELAAALDAAGVLADPGRLPTALEAFEQAMRPRIASAQQLPPGRVASVAPRTALGIRVNALAMRLLRSRALRPLVRRAMAGTEHGRTPGKVTVTTAAAPAG
ncbi:hypothetical protein [Kitasatospora terrestris]|uniref:FAD-binding domain-containing protein n=1 Tax=Kitasatospora terrestris TaxID=258051 RepID=A0ABP9EXY7_9ACTN